MDWLDEETVVFGAPCDYRSALIGVDVREGRAVYDYDLMVAFLLEQNPEWTEDDAVEWLDFNTLGAHCDGEPIVIRRFEEEGR